MNRKPIADNIPAQTGQIEYLNVIRIVALFLILYSHLVCVACSFSELPDIFANSAMLPVIRFSTGHVHGSGCGPLGVVLFILLSGFLAARSREKYDNAEFFKRRIIRLWPGLILSLTLITAVVSLIGGVKITGWQYFFNILLLHPFVGLPVITGVVWVLIVEMFGHLILTHVKNINVKSISVINAIIMFLLFFQINSGNTSLQTLLYYLAFVPLMLFGCAISKYGLKSIKTIFLGLWACAILFMSVHGHGYKNMNIYLLAILIWISAYFACKYIKMPKINVLSKIKSMLINTSYVVYLIHVPIGLTIMYYLRDFLPPVLNVITSTLLMFGVAMVLHYCMEKPISNYLNKKFLPKH